MALRATISGAWTRHIHPCDGAVDSKWTSIRRGDGQQSAQQQRIVHGSSASIEFSDDNSFTPTSGTFGTTVTINGAFFSNAIDVKFNGTSAASFHVDSSTQITAIVPAGVTTGPISVTNTSGTTASSTNFTVSLIKLSTFENGTLTDPATGVTSTSGSGSKHRNRCPLKGPILGTRDRGQFLVAGRFARERRRLRVLLSPIECLAVRGGPHRHVLRMGTTVGNLNLTTAGALTLRNNTTNIATSSPLIVGQIYRVALHQKKSTGNNAFWKAFSFKGTRLSVRLSLYYRTGPGPPRRTPSKWALPLAPQSTSWLTTFRSTQRCRSRPGPGHYRVQSDEWFRRNVGHDHWRQLRSHTIRWQREV